jgi:hypothetical protein
MNICESRSVFIILVLKVANVTHHATHELPDQTFVKLDHGYPPRSGTHSGRTVLRETIGPSTGYEYEIEIDLSGIAAGMYQCQLVENGSLVAGRELMITR